MTILDNILTAISYLALCFILFLVGKWIYRLFQRRIQVQHELVEKDNFAFAVAHVGYFIGLLLSIVSAVVGPSDGLYYDIIDIQNTNEPLELEKNNVEKNMKKKK